MKYMEAVPLETLESYHAASALSTHVSVVRSICMKGGNAGAMASESTDTVMVIPPVLNGVVVLVMMKTVVGPATRITGLWEALPALTIAAEPEITVSVSWMSIAYGYGVPSENVRETIGGSSVTVGQEARITSVSRRSEPAPVGVQI